MLRIDSVALSTLFSIGFDNAQNCVSILYIYRLIAENGLHPPLGNLGDISYLIENFKPGLLRDVCTLYSETLVSDSLLLMLPY